MADNPNWIHLMRRDKQWRMCLERAFSAYSDVFTILSPTIDNNSDAQMIPNAKITAHPPGQPNNQIHHTITYVDFMDADKSKWDEIAARHVEVFLKIYRTRIKTAAKVAASRDIIDTMEGR